MYLGKENEQPPLLQDKEGLRGANNLAIIPQKKK